MTVKATLTVSKKRKSLDMYRDGKDLARTVVEALLTGRVPKDQLSQEPTKIAFHPMNVPYMELNLPRANFHLRYSQSGRDLSFQIETDGTNYNFIRMLQDITSSKKGYLVGEFKMDQSEDK
jgi:hypothetical protein